MAMTGIIDLTPLFEIVGEDGSRRLAPFSDAVAVRAADKNSH